MALHCALLPLVVLPATILLVASPWLWVGPACFLAIVMLGDECMAEQRHDPSPVTGPWGDVWLALFGIELVVYLLAGFSALSRQAPDAARIAVFCLVTGLLFGAAYNVAHDLIHRVAQRGRWSYGYLLLVLLGDSQLSVSHVYSHHPGVATADDPASARLGESLYRFVPRSTVGQYRAAWRFESDWLARRGRARWSWRNRVLAGSAATVAVGAGVLAAFGGVALVCYGAACLIGKFLFESANYVQHYGLLRLPGERVEPHHSWDCLAPFSRFFMFNQNHHANHHIRPSLRCWQLGPEPRAAAMPYGYLTMIAMANVPLLWFRVMNPKALRVRQGGGQPSSELSTQEKT